VESVLPTQTTIKNLIAFNDVVPEVIWLLPCRMRRGNRTDINMCIFLRYRDSRSGCGRQSVLFVCNTVQTGCSTEVHPAALLKECFN
jgi:hypothetical protein